MTRGLHAEILQRAVRLVGGRAELRRLLRVSMRDLDAWIEGAERAPTNVFLRVVDLIDGHRLEDEKRRREIAGIAGHALDAALKGRAAARGNLQLVTAESLTIVGQRGFERPFLDFFATIARRDGESSACAAATKRAARVIVPDVASDPIFAGTRAGEVLLKAGCLAVQSTPIVASSGELVGILSTHYEEPGEPPAADLESIAELARRVAPLLEARALAGR